jgi:branched-chain amino acid transport system ATP-binding protein
VIVKKLSKVIRQLKEKGFTIVLVEQNFRFAAPLADRMYVVERGRIAVEIQRHEVAEKQALLEELLGV